MEESKRLEDHVTNANDIKMKSIAEFQKAYEVSLYSHCTYIFCYNFLTCQFYATQEQSKSDAEKLIANISNLVTDHICRQKEMVCVLLMFFML